jgi:hypothetical protein
MDVLLTVIIAIVVFGVFLGVARFAINKFFPEFMDYFQVLVWIALAALFIYLLIAVWPFLTGAMTPRGARGESRTPPPVRAQVLDLGRLPVPSL